MPAPYTGGCQCGAVRYEIRAEPICVYACHCTECQRQTSSAFGLSMVVLADAVVVTEGSPARTERGADSGNKVAGDFCTACGTRLFHRPEHRPEAVNVKPGSLDDPSWVRPAAHFWTQSALGWAVPDDGAIRYDTQPPDLSEVIARWREMG